LGKRVPLAGCVFCGGRPLTAEHALGQWFRTSAGLAAPARVTKYRDNAVTHEKYKPSFSEKLRVACRACNTGWMHDLEDAVLPYLSQMVWGRQRILVGAEQRQLAAWFVKTCCVCEYVDLQPGHHIPRSHYEQLQARRTSPPDWCQVWLGTARLPSVDFGVRLTQWRYEAVSHPGTRDSGWIGTLRIGPVVLQALGCATRPTHMNRDDLRGGLIQIWPVTQHIIGFPGRPYVNFEQILPSASPDRPLHPALLDRDEP
jgi:hypothetical protein